MTKKWIQDVVKSGHKGSLTSWAKEHRLMTKGGTINLNRAERYARRRGLTHRLKQVNLARNLRAASGR